jgi:N utilization substance protein A
MSNEIIHAIEQVGREKGIELDIIIHAVEDAYAAAAKKYFRTKEELGARFDRDSGVFDVFARKKVVEEVTNPDLEISPDEAQGMELPQDEEGIVEILKPRDELIHLGRIAAQAAKQIIFQKVREAERDNIFKEYAGRLGEMINGVVKRFERGNIIVDLGRTEGVLPKKEQSKAERYSQGDRIRAVIVDVDSNAKGPQVVISRTDERLLMKLFEMEVPEIYDGTVMIERAVRDPGDRAKVAVRSKDRDVDPVGACVGMKGSRVQSIIRELRGEKIDIVQYSEEVSSFVMNSLNPAKINRVQIVDPEERALEVVVDDEQLSLAIGKKGQNVRLASRLAGWRIDIKSEQDKRREVEAEIERRAREVREVECLEGIGEKTIERLLESGCRSIDAILEANVAGLTELPGIGTKGAEKIVAAAQAMMDTRPEREAEEARLLAEEQARAAEEEAAALATRQEAELAAQAEAELQEQDQEAQVQEAQPLEDQQQEGADQQGDPLELEGSEPAEAPPESEPEQRLEGQGTAPVTDGTPEGEDPVTTAPENGTDSDEEHRRES